MDGRLLWDVLRDRFYETGVDHCVLYKPVRVNKGAKVFKNGVAWSGVTSINESPSGGEPTALYADNVKYLNLVSAEDYGASIEAYSYPEEFSDCVGAKAIAKGVYALQQDRVTFGLAYRTMLSNPLGDTFYKIHLIYNCKASPSETGHSTVNESPEAVQYTWNISTTPVNAKDAKPVSSVTIDTRKLNFGALKGLEIVLFGDDENTPRLPYPDELMEIYWRYYDKYEGYPGQAIYPGWDLYPGIR